MCEQYLQWRGQVWRHITMVAKFLDDNNREVLQRRRPRFSVHFLAIVARLWHETSYFHGPALRSSCEFRYGTFRFNPEISSAFDKFNEIE